MTERSTEHDIKEALHHLAESEPIVDGWSEVAHAAGRRSMRGGSQLIAAAVLVILGGWWLTSTNATQDVDAITEDEIEAAALLELCRNGVGDLGSAEPADVQATITEVFDATPDQIVFDHPESDITRIIFTDSLNGVACDLARDAEAAVVSFGVTTRISDIGEEPGSSSGPWGYTDEQGQTWVGVIGNLPAGSTSIQVTFTSGFETDGIVRDGWFSVMAQVPPGGDWSSYRVTIGSDAETTPTVEDFVRPGEKVISANPLVVEPAPTPTADFDTDPLGTEFPFGEAGATGLDYEDLSGQPLDDLKITILGTIDGEPVVARMGDVVDGDTPGLEGMRGRTIAGLQGSPVLFWDPTNPAAFDIDRPITQQDPIWSAPTGYAIWGLLPEGTAVVTFRDSDRRLWQQPRDGVAIFRSELDTDESFTLTALDAQGVELDAYTGTADYAFVPDPSVRIGDPIGVILASDPLTGEEVRIEPDGRSVVFAIGASWCVPCQSVQTTIERSNTSAVRVYAVDYNPTRKAAWEWPNEIVAINVDTAGTLWGLVPALPTVIILDGEHRLLATTSDPTELPALLDELGLN